MDVSLLTQADFVLSKCGRPVAPRGLSILPLPKSFLVQQVFDAAATTPLQTVTKEITGETTWELRAIQISSSSSPVTAISLQILLPDGKFLINNLQDALQIAGYGSYRYCFTPGKKCPPGSKIQVTFQVTDSTNQQPMAISLDGAYLYYLKGGVNRICPTDEAAADLPRYFGNGTAENIFAPCWQHGVGPFTPLGFRDDDFVYSAKLPANATFPQGAPGTTISVTAANLAAIQMIGMDNAEFHVRRVLFEVIADDTVTAGTVLARLRDGSGYAFTDDYMDVARYIGSAPYPRDWIIAPNDSVFADLQLVDQAGTGNVYFTMYLEGFKRTRVS